MTQIKKGYKQTDIGIIPEDWEVVQVGDMLNVTTGAKNTQDKKDDGEYPFFVRSQNVERINSYSYECEGVLTAGDGVGTGKVFHYINGRFDFHQRVYLMHNFDVNLDGYFFFLVFKTNFYNRMMQMTAKSSVDSVRKEMITEMQIAIPPTRKEQQAIAEVLSDIDSLIEVLDKKIAKKRAIKEGAMQQLLTGKKRLAGFTEPWVEKKLGEIAEIKDGTHQTPKYVIDGIPFYSVENVTNNDFKNTKTISIEEHKFLTKSYKIEKGNVLMTRIGSIGVCKLINWDVEASFYVSLALLKFKKEYSAEFFTHYSNINGFVKEIEDHSLQFATPKKINLGNVSLVKLYFPKSLKEQQAIAQILTDMDDEIEQLEKEQQKYIALKQGAMQQLLTGQIRLVNAALQTQNILEIKAISIDAHVIGGHIVNMLHTSNGWGRTKLQKTMHLVDYFCQIDFGGEYIRNIAGPDNQQLMNYIDSKFEQFGQIRIELRKDRNSGHKHYNYIPTHKITEVEQAFEHYPTEKQKAINDLLNKIKKMDLARAEIVSTLYAVWNNRIIKGQPINNDLLLKDFYNWSEHKSDYSRDLVLRGLNYMQQDGIIPMGWGKYIDKKGNKTI